MLQQRSGPWCLINSLPEFVCPSQEILKQVICIEVFHRLFPIGMLSNGKQDKCYGLLSSVEEDSNPDPEEVLQVS